MAPVIATARKSTSSSSGKSRFAFLSDSDDSVDEVKMPSNTTTAEACQPPAKRVKRDYMETIVVIVGEDAKCFTVHKDMICNKSPFFAAACAKDWIEGQKGRVKLPYFNAEYFHFYVDWIYSRKFDEDALSDAPLPFDGTKKKQPLKSKDGWSTRVTLTHICCTIFIMADYLGDHDCKKHCMKLLVAQVTKKEPVPTLWILPQTVQLISRDTSDNFGLFHWVVDAIAVMAWGKDQAQISPFLQGIPSGVRDALLLKFMCHGKSARHMGKVDEYLD